MQVGIYMLLDVNSPLAGESINRGDPYSSYYTAYLNRTFAVVEAFKDYPNTLAFFSANEVINNVETGKDNPPIIRAVTRDLKEYVKNHASRPIPVGYSAADVRDNLLDSWNYLREWSGDQDKGICADEKQNVACQEKVTTCLVETFSP